MSSTLDDWERHWQDYSETAEQNPAQNYRRKLIMSLLGVQGSGEGVRIIDIGSGQGDMAAAIRFKFPSAAIMGLELSQSGVEISRRKVPSARFIQRNLLDQTEPLGDTRGWATHAVCSEVIEHLDDPAVLLKNARAYMQDGCRLIVTAPGGPMSAFDKHIGHRKHWRPHEIERLLRDAGFKSEQVTGVGFPFFNLYRCLVILRGKKLISDVSAGPAARAPWTARAAMALFHQLIRPNLNSSRWGWQMVAKARVGGLRHEASEYKPDAKRKRDSAQHQDRARPLTNGDTC
jgi:SAM-dependent methyltransferase